MTDHNNATEHVHQQQEQRRNPITTQNELVNYIIDVDDEDCPEFGLHLASYQGDLNMLNQLLTSSSEDVKNTIDTRIRPFLASPLRLAATAGHLGVIRILLEAGAQVDLADVKAQTPLFVAIVNQHWESARVLLEAGADPNGSDKNM